MAQPLIAAMPNDVILSSGYVVRVVALDPTTGATVAGVRLTDVAFQVQPTDSGGPTDTGTGTPLPLLVPSDDTFVEPTPSLTPAPSPSTQAPSGPLHTQAKQVTDTSQRTFALAVADKLEPVSVPTVQLPSGSSPFHVLANAITDTAVYLWAAAVANVLEPV